MNTCQAGHERHDRKIVPCHAGDLSFDMSVYDYDKYKGFAGYCTGQDDISNTLSLYGIWEPAETSCVLEILQNAREESLVLDFGTHIGWFSILAALHGHVAWGYEGDQENILTLEDNARMNGVEDLVSVQHKWIDGSLGTLSITHGIELMKCDLEGNDRFAVETCSFMFETQSINYALIEISPCFNDTYPDMVNYILSCGYEAFYADADKRPWDNDFSEPQFNLLFVRT